MEPIFFEPIFKERIWGGTALKEVFGYDIPFDNIGECWGISAHANGMTTVKYGRYKGKTLEELWKKNKDLFGGINGQIFPLMVKILDANQDLSVQVHPDDDCAQIKGTGKLGKTECWYIINCKKNSEIVYGHNATTREEFIRLVEEKKYNELFRRVKIKPGDFFYIPSGTVHALCKGGLVLEIQQNSDITYRIYDYDREEADGKKRELHIKDAIEVIKIPHLDIDYNMLVEEKKNIIVTTFIKTPFFHVHKWDVREKATILNESPFSLVSVIEGRGKIVHKNITYTIKKGDHFLLPAGFRHFTIIGKCELIVSHV